MLRQFANGAFISGTSVENSGSTNYGSISAAVAGPSTSGGGGIRNPNYPSLPPPYENSTK